MEGCMEVCMEGGCGGVYGSRGVWLQGCMEGCMEVCMEVCMEGVYGGVYGGVCGGVYGGCYDLVNIFSSPFVNDVMTIISFYSAMG